MPVERREMLRALSRPDDKLRCAAAWLLLRFALGSEAQRIRRGRYGKLFLPGGPSFNLSHSGRYAVLAKSPQPVGADVEEICPETDCAALASHILHPKEFKYYANQQEPSTLFDIWTLKESYLKLKGIGLNEDPASFALKFESGQIYMPERPDVHFRLYHQLPGHSVAICLYRCKPPETIVPVHL